MNHVVCTGTYFQKWVTYCVILAQKYEQIRTFARCAYSVFMYAFVCLVVYVSTCMYLNICLWEIPMNMNIYVQYVHLHTYIHIDTYTYIYCNIRTILTYTYISTDTYNTYRYVHIHTIRTYTYNTYRYNYTQMKKVPHTLDASCIYIQIFTNTNLVRICLLFYRFLDIYVQTRTNTYNIVFASIL